jgi:RND family efflux transporter MFP subunit
VFALAAVMYGAIAAAAEGTLETAVVQFREVDLTYAAEAVVEATRQSTVSAQVTGRIVELRYDVGDYVEKGRVIARIDQTEASQVLAGSRAQVAQAQAAFDNARAEVERTRDLARQKFVSPAALDKAEAAFRGAGAQLETARAGAGQAAASRDHATVIAPYSGVVSARHVELGEMAAPGKPLLTGFDPTDLRVVATVPQYKVAEVRATSRAMVEIPSTGKWIRATAVTVLPSADAQTHSTRVRLDLPHDLRDVYPGVFARAHFATGRARKLVLPAAAVIRRSEVTGVYTVDEKGRVLFRQVRLGEAAGDQGIEVLAGVASGDSVALDPVRAGMRAARQRVK